MLLEGIEGGGPVGTASLDSDVAFFGTRSLRLDPVAVPQGTAWKAGLVLVEGEMLRQGCRVTVVTQGTSLQGFELNVVAVDSSDFSAVGVPVAGGSSAVATEWTRTQFMFTAAPDAPAVVALCATETSASPWHLGRLEVSSGEENTPAIAQPPAPRSLSLVVPRTTGDGLCQGWFFADHDGAAGREWDLVANFGDDQRRTFLGRVFAGPAREATPVDVPGHLVRQGREASVVALAPSCYGPREPKLPVQVIVA
jgi:hypothetical protein